MPQDIPLIGPIVNRIFGTRNERFVRRYLARVEEINALEPRVRAMTDAQIKDKTSEFRQRMAKGAGAMDLLVETFAVAREAMDRAVGIRNIFNPKYRDQFPADKLTPELRALYQQTMAAMDAAEPRPPEGELLGCPEPQAGWQWMDIPVELYEAVREMFPESRPPFRARPFDVQLIGGMVLYGGKISEMKTGEGKTIVAPLACYLAVLEGRRVHVVTVNDYLVQRDRDWTYPYFRALGLTVGAIHPMHMQDEDEKRRMYQCDVVYGTTSEFGFDYLRDNMKRTVDAQVQRAREFAIVDEVDSILIDEARTPLIISGPAHEDAPRYELADQLARHLVKMQEPWGAANEKVDACKRLIKGTEGDIRNARDKSTIPALNEKLRKTKAELPALEVERGKFTQYYEVEMERKAAHLTHHGVMEAQKKANIGSFYVGDNIDMPHLVQQALRAHVVYERDRDYIVAPVQDPQTGRTEPGVVIVDVNTGRPMIGRQWSDGLHQAVEAKEAVKIKQETQTVATITIQNFFKMYKRLAGMTGTADTEAQEFNDIYKLDVVTIPTNLPVIRSDFDDVVYLTGKDKWGAIVDEIKAFHDMGRPVLVGTTSVEKSEMLAKMLTSKHGIKHEVLNAKQHEREAHIIENAGQLGAVMIATNMAGRGTDIKLGKVMRQTLLDHWLRRSLAPRELTTEASDEQVRELIFRKVAPKELEIPKHEAEKMPFADLELALLRKWAESYTWLDPRKIPAMDAQALRQALDEQGRFRLHRIGWVESVEQLGGLHVIGTERHESRRIDNQLRGRSGRQGDRGSSRFFVALDDELMKLFAGNTTMKVLSRLGMKEGDAIEHPMLSRSIVRAQRKVEERNFQVRKNILEYDEVMEHQRRGFYGMRQRVLEGRDVKGLIFEFIEEASTEAVGRYLDKDYFAECVGEYARERLGCSIAPERLRGLDLEDAQKLLRREAKDDARHEIGITLGEYVAESADEDTTLAQLTSSGFDVDSKGLISWAQGRFKIEVSEGDLLHLTRRQVRERLQDAAFELIDNADLNDLDKYLARDYGPSELSKWVRSTFGLEVTSQEILEKENPEDVVAIIVERVLAEYTKREHEYPVDFVMELTVAMVCQSGPQAISGLVQWANTRFGLGWTDSTVRTRMPQQIREELLKAAKAFYQGDALQRAIDEALACADNEALKSLMQNKYGVHLPPWLLRLQGEDRAQAIRARVESILRAEMLQFERYVLLEVLDPAWKDHLYAMDQLRDAIGFRAFSQQDPRIEYKREGSRLYREMLGKVRDRVAEYLFKLRLMPQVGPMPGPSGPPVQAPPQQQQPARSPAPRPAPAAPAPSGAAALLGAAGSGTRGVRAATPPGAPQQRPGGSSISGPGIDPPADGGRGAV